MTTATTPTRSNAPDYDEIVRVVHLYSDAFGAGEINMFKEAFHEDAWIFFTDAEGNLVRCLISECFEEWSQPAMGKANGRVISVTQAGDVANVLLGWDRPDDAANSYVDLHNLIRLTAYGRSRTRLLRTSAEPPEFERWPLADSPKR